MRGSFYSRNDAICARCAQPIGEDDSPLSCNRCNAEDARKKDLVKNSLGRELTGSEIVEILALMLGWANTPPWHVLEKDLREKLRRLEELSRLK